MALYHLQIIHIHDTHMYNRGIFHCAFSKRNLCIQKCASWLLSLFSYHWGAVMSETWLLVSATQLLQGKRQCGHISSEYKWEYIILPNGDGELHRTNNMVSQSLRISRNYRKKEKRILESERVPCRDEEKQKKKIFLNLAYGKRRLHDSSVSI